MRVKIITRAQEQEEAARKAEDARACFERVKFVRRCLDACRDARDYIVANTSPVNISPPGTVIRGDLLARLNALIERKPDGGQETQGRVRYQGQ